MKQEMVFPTQKDQDVAMLGRELKVYNSERKSTHPRIPHTLGPWKIVQECVDPEWYVITARFGRVMANIHIENGNATDRANANLIAAAPEMYKSLKQWQQFMHDNYKPDDITWWDETESAINNAEVS